jgi:predicted lipoprotein with Yx(FWY)xxD motif
VALGIVAGAGGAHATETGLKTEAWSQVPMPPGFQVVPTELEGPVFADSKGHTLYTWPIQAMRSGYAGDPKDKSVCEDKITTKTGGYMSPYPPGLDLPELDKRKSCLAEWPAALADADAKPVGKFTIITRSDGTKQWAYDNHALYTSVLDHETGDVNGGTMVFRTGGDTPAEREPAAPPPDIPPGFRVHTTVRGRMLLTEKRMSVYFWDKDEPDKSNCHGACEQVWQPVAAPESAKPHGDWTVIENGTASRQWAYRHKPLYTYARDVVPASLDGSVDHPTWHNVYTQIAPQPPKAFTVQQTIVGDVLADSSGKTVYFYTCGDDSADQLSCDTTEESSPPEYREAICGGFDAARCARLWHYVPANADDKSGSQVWSVITIDPATGHAAQPGQAGAQTVWAYRGRPLYTYAEDKQPGDYNGNAAGEWQGRRNGFRAFWIRNEAFGSG